eukprot:m.87136 g.87136  ORF g.87136 m.87136 type:complete len:303 (+) comp50958_c0_seq6:13-921(+)
MGALIPRQTKEKKEKTGERKKKRKRQARFLKLLLVIKQQGLSRLLAHKHVRIERTWRGLVAVKAKNTILRRLRTKRVVGRFAAFAQEVSLFSDAIGECGLSCAQENIRTCTNNLVDDRALAFTEKWLFLEFVFNAFATWIAEEAQLCLAQLSVFTVVLTSIGCQEDSFDFVLFGKSRHLLSSMLNGDKGVFVRIKEIAPTQMHAQVRHFDHVGLESFGLVVQLWRELETPAQFPVGNFVAKMDLSQLLKAGNQHRIAFTLHHRVEDNVGVSLRAITAHFLCPDAVSTAAKTTMPGAITVLLV